MIHGEPLWLLSSDAHLGLGSGLNPTSPGGRDREKDPRAAPLGSFIPKLSAYGAGNGEFWDAPSGTETQGLQRGTELREAAEECWGQEKP